jgi:hypothetical protein
MNTYQIGKKSQIGEVHEPINNLLISLEVVSDK